MRTLILNSDLKRLFAGAGVAVASGLLMGAAMQPNLDLDSLEGPQQLVSGGGPRAYALAHDPGVAAYEGRVPDHVIGTDALKPSELEALAHEDLYEPAPYAEAMAADGMASDASATAGTVRWEAEPREPTRYPSEHGATYHGADPPPPPDAPAEADEAWSPV